MNKEELSGVALAICPLIICYQAIRVKHVVNNHVINTRLRDLAWHTEDGERTIISSVRCVIFFCVLSLVLLFSTVGGQRLS